MSTNKAESHIPTFTEATDTAAAENGGHGAGAGEGGGGAMNGRMCKVQGCLNQAVQDVAVCPVHARRWGGHSPPYDTVVLYVHIGLNVPLRPTEISTLGASLSATVLVHSTYVCSCSLLFKLRCVLVRLHDDCSRYCLSGAIITCLKLVSMIFSL